MKFSVIVCTYNYAHMLPDALRTIAAQTVSDFELLVVDDGSTDNTEEVVAQFRSLFKGCRYLKKSHTGLADTRNVAVRAAQGSHVAFLDADDLWSPHYLNAAQEGFRANPEAGLVLCEGITFQTDDGILTEAVLDKGLPPLRGPVCSAHDLFPLLQAFSPSGMAFSKALYNQIGPFDVETFGSFGNDLDWTLRALMAGAFCVCVKRRLYLYRRHADNMTNKASDSFQAWLAIYSQTLREDRANRQVKALVRGIIRSHSLRVLPTCSTDEGRHLIRSGIETLGGDPYLRLNYVGTYLGFVSLLKLLKQMKQLCRRSFRRPLAIDLKQPVEAIFDALPK